jgi:hypothetical protein
MTCPRTGTTDRLLPALRWPWRVGHVAKPAAAWEATSVCGHHGGVRPVWAAEYPGTRLSQTTSQEPSS